MCYVKQIKTVKKINNKKKSGSFAKLFHFSLSHKGRHVRVLLDRAPKQNDDSRKFGILLSIAMHHGKTFIPPLTVFILFLSYFHATFDAIFIINFNCI